QTPIGPLVGACGASAHFKTKIVIHDTHKDERTRPFLPQIDPLHVRAIWSYPILGSMQQVLGTFALYRSRPYSPDAEEIRLTEMAARLAGLAIERHLQTEQFVRREDRFRRL